MLTGHSLGATIATVAALDLAENVTNGYSGLPPVTAIVFGSPRVGNKEFSNRVNGHSNANILHVKNEIDLITRYPAKIMGYVNIGTKLKIDTRVTPFNFLKKLVILAIGITYRQVILFCI